MAAETVSASTESLFSAIRSGDRAQVEQLLDARPELVGTPNADGLSPVMWALYNGQRDIADVLLARLPEDSLTIHEAAATGRVARLEAVLASTPEAVNSWSPDGFQPLGLAAFFGHPAAVDLLLARGGEINTVAQHSFGVTALHAALASPTPEVARVLVAAGADVNIPQRSGATPLHETAHNGSLELTTFLLEHGANPAARDTEGRTPADIARAQDHPDVAELIEASRSS
jgi:ankyrin repeat protein